MMAAGVAVRREDSMTTITPRTRPYQCCYCQQRLGDLVLGCERCGASFHGGCYEDRLPRPERHTLTATERPYRFLCHRCRS